MQPNLELQAYIDNLSDTQKLIRAIRIEDAQESLKKCRELFTEQGGRLLKGETRAYGRFFASCFKRENRALRNSGATEQQIIDQFLLEIGSTRSELRYFLDKAGLIPNESDENDE